jgi:hypothetical protein
MADAGSTDDQWTLAPAERALVITKNRSNRLGAGQTGGEVD